MIRSNALVALASLASMTCLAAGVLALTMGPSACRTRPAPASAPEAAEWQLLASDLPSSLMSVAARSPVDVYAVGADKGHGPLVLHYDGESWIRLDTHESGDLWWVQTLPDATIMAGADGMILRYDGGKTHGKTHDDFTRLPTPGLAKQTIYGVWGKSGDDFYAVGSAAGRDGFLWHYHGGEFETEKLPRNLPRTAAGELPGFFKVWGTGDDVWVVGSSGSFMHRKGTGPFEVVPTGTKETLFTIHGTPERCLAVGGSSNGVLLEMKEPTSAMNDRSPVGAGLIQGVFATDTFGDWASGERGMVYERVAGGAFAPVDHGRTLPPTSSLHSIYVDPTGGVWSAGGNVLTPALDGGVLLHYGPPVAKVDYADPAEAKPPPVTCPAEVVSAGKSGSVARRWDEQALAAIRLDLPRPTVHARNLFHASAAMWDAWAAYDTKAAGVYVHERHTAVDVGAARRTAISYAAYDLLSHRYAKAIGGATSLACFAAVMKDLGLDPSDVHDTGDDPTAVGNRIGHSVVATTLKDGADEAGGYDPPHDYDSPNAALVFDNAGAPLDDPAHWQPINLAVAATQNGIILPAGVQSYIGSTWGKVAPFAMKRTSDAVPWHDPGPVPSPSMPAMKDWIVEVIRKTAQIDATDPATIDISPGAYGHNSLGANDGHGWAKNPVTGQPYAPEVVPMSDFARVMAEFWADGPKSETPPGHWNVIANLVADSPGFERKLFGKGPALDPLSWDVRVYLALNGAAHDAAITAWDLKRRDTTVRPISLIRWMGAKGQSSDPHGPSYDPMGLPLVPGLIEVITADSSASGQRHEALSAFVGQIAVRDWLGEPADRKMQVGGVGWVRAVDWITYQRRTFVTPAFPAFISGHSTFSRAGAEVLASLTGSPYFPGGFAEYVMPKDGFLTFEKGPSREIRLQWASYYDASDEAGQSRIWGGIHIWPDDQAGRKLGHLVGVDAVARASRYFDGSVK